MSDVDVASGTASAANEIGKPAMDSAANELPLCVDLDGTLVKSDTLLDAILLLARQQPRSPLSWPAWLQQGKAGFKREVTSRASIEIEHLPWNQPLLAYLREEHARGRRIYLATAADIGFAEKVAGHLDLFTGILASNGSLNLAGSNKLAAFQQQFPQGFSYIGNALPDRTLLQASHQPMVANPHGKLRTALRRDNVVPHRQFFDRKPPASTLLKAIRIHQWAKNFLVFLPALLSHNFHANTIVASLFACFSLSFCASATYILNDLLDIEADRRHPRKRRRPFASGDLSPLSGMAILACFFACSILLALALPHAYAALPGIAGVHEVLARPYRFLEWLGLYTITTLAYSFYLKRRALVDVIVLSGLYTIRILAGSAATEIAVSAWLAAFSIFFFLSLAFVKRFAELELMLTSGRTTASGRGYGTADMEQLRSFGTSSAFASVVVLTMYISGLADVLYAHPSRLWLMVPVLILWICRVWLLASRGELHEDPVVYAITDRTSWLLGAISIGIVWWAL